MLVDREVHEWTRAIGGYWMSAITNEVKWWAQQGESGVSASIARRRANARASREGWNSPMRSITNEVKWWAQ